MLIQIRKKLKDDPKFTGWAWTRMVKLKLVQSFLGGPCQKWQWLFSS